MNEIDKSKTFLIFLLRTRSLWNIISVLSSHKSYTIQYLKFHDLLKIVIAYTHLWENILFIIDELVYIIQVNKY
jgi:hypothetical protein